MRLSKHHGLGNDFLVSLIDEVPADAGDLARAWCHRTRGIGADGLIFGTPTGEADVAMTLFNADGSAAEISGNGIRCLAQAVMARNGADTLRVLTAAGVRDLRLVESAGTEAYISVDMGAVSSAPQHPCLEQTRFASKRAAVRDVGNPHLVVEIDDLDDIDIAVDGPALEALFAPVGMNVHFMVESGPAQISLLHWERGVGVTEACGSGATVSAALANEWGIVGSTVDVVMPGGTAKVVLEESATLIGPAVHIADVEIAHG
ncbi:MAG: diaminopimelate epimerase [Acidimicrobiales bacterium]